MITTTAALPIVLIGLEDGYVSDAQADCITLTRDPTAARRFNSEKEALAFLTLHAPRLVAWTPCIQFWRFGTAISIGSTHLSPNLH